LNFEQRRLAGLDNTARQDVSVDYGYTSMREDLGRSGFAHANAAGEPE